MWDVLHALDQLRNLCQMLRLPDLADDSFISLFVVFAMCMT